MTQPSGWYDDPNDADLLRYWDGVVWTSHVAPAEVTHGGPVRHRGGPGPRQHRAATAARAGRGSTAGTGQHGAAAARRPTVAGRPARPPAADHPRRRPPVRLVAARRRPDRRRGDLRGPHRAGDVPGARPCRRHHVRLLPRQHRRGAERRHAAARSRRAGLAPCCRSAWPASSSTWPTRSCCSPGIGTTPGRRLVGISVRLRERPGAAAAVGGGAADVRQGGRQHRRAAAGRRPPRQPLHDPGLALAAVGRAPAGPARQGRPPPTSSSASSRAGTA